MKLSRRTFLKLAGTAAGSVALTGLWGCAASSGASGGGGADASTKGPEGANANNSQNVGANAGDRGRNVRLTRYAKRFAHNFCLRRCKSVLEFAPCFS